MPQLLDFSAALIDPAAIKAAGYAGVVGYFSGRRPGAEWMLAKPLTRDYCDRLRATGLEIVSNYQFGKGDTSDWKGGFDAGVYHARIALANHVAAGGPPDRPLFAPVDSNPSLDEWNSQIAPFLHGWESVVGHERTGMYGNARCIDWALEDGVATWFWQHNWSGDPSINGDHPAAHIHQIRIDQDAVAGVAVDVNITLKDDYGQWSKAVASPPVSPSIPTTAPEVVTVNQPAFIELDRMGNSGSSRHGARITNFLLHTQEGDGTAESLATYLNDPSHDASYHYTVRDGVVADVVDTDLGSWSVLDANPYTINLCFAGSRAGWSREDWLSIEDDVRIAAWIAVQDAKKYGFSTDVIAPPYYQGDGLSDHKYVTQQLGIGSHTDVGYNFIWDRFGAFVNEYASGAPAPVQGNAINDCFAANAWLGARLTDGEIATPDNVGRRAEFEGGQIYWHPSTGAHAIPTDLFGKFAELGWEAGTLGYPITDRTVLAGGEVQGFQGGAIYRQDDKFPVWVHGAIRDRWNRTGYEVGPFGWPTADEQPFDGAAFQDFEHGRIHWTPKPTLALLNADGADTPVPDTEGGK